MKKLFTFFLLATLITSCSVQSLPEEEEAQKHLIGKWKLIKRSGGISGETKEYGAEHDKIIIQFTEDDFRKSLNGKIMQEAKYEIKEGESIRTTTEVPLIIYSTGVKQSFEWSSGNLILYDECYDCFQSEYVKL